ncbi:S1C family serine protease [Gorillibacterium sp. sgz5001074]|uniref:S1C family serine protease n=1 Tax=Gorillibacterium sp. sgz5001074 TaxID=3446695 RepID=UPI003F67F37C
MKKWGYRIAAGAMAAALLQGTAWGTAVQASPSEGDPGVTMSIGPVKTMISAESNDTNGQGAGSGNITQAIQATSPSVVAIIGKHKTAGSSAGRFDLAHGTGVIVRSDGYIVTNAHVVQEMDPIVVVTADGKQYAGKTTHMDEESDLALVRIEATGLKPAVFAAPTAAQVGDTVIAIGTPISFSLRNSVTVGVISGLDRSVNSTYRLLQTDAAINPGNSGGALVNLKGEVVGINTLKFSDYGVDNLGFAIPSDTVQYVLKHFLQYGKVKRPYAGLELEESWAAVVGIPSDEPPTVSYVEPGSPADKAGIKSGDKLLSVGGKPVRNLVEFNELLKGYLPGESANFALVSGTSDVSRSVTFGELQQEDGISGAAAGKEGDFDSDAGKTHIGDSRYGWSMKYPSGADTYYQSKKGNSITLGDAKGEYSLHVSVEEKSYEYSKSALLKSLSSQAEGGTILDRKYVDGKNGSYARVISKDDYGYYELRAYDHGDYIYYVGAAIYSEQVYKNSMKRKGYTELLDSFTFAFDKSDKTLKDIAVEDSGYQRYVHPEYGYSFSVPAEWEEDYSVTGRYENSGSTRHAEVYMASMAEGDTLSAWADRTASRIAGQYAAGYVEAGETENAKVAGLAAKEWTFSYTLGDKWTTVKYFFVEKDGYKYRLEIGYPKETPAKEAEELVSKVKASFELSGSRNASIGYMEDEEDLIDYANKVEYRSKDFGYALEVPEYWERSGRTGSAGDDDEGERVTFAFTGGSFSISADKSQSYAELLEEMEKSQKESKENDADYKLEITDIEILGLPAKQFDVHYSIHKVPYEDKSILFAKNGVTYEVRLRLKDAVRTETNLKDLKGALESLRFKGE